MLEPSDIGSFSMKSMDIEFKTFLGSEVVLEVHKCKRIKLGIRYI